MKERDQLEEIKNPKPDEYNRYRILDEIIFDYFYNGMCSDVFKDIFLGGIQGYIHKNGRNIGKKYNKDYYSEEVLSA